MNGSKCVNQHRRLYSSWQSRRWRGVALGRRCPPLPATVIAAPVARRNATPTHTIVASAPSRPRTAALSVSEPRVRTSKSSATPRLSGDDTGAAQRAEEEVNFGRRRCRRWGSDKEWTGTARGEGGDGSPDDDPLARPVEAAAPAAGATATATVR
nr:unnamed protein product [Digitaria exilis]